MVIPKNSKVDAFHRQLSALRHQLGGEHETFARAGAGQSRVSRVESPYRTNFPELESIEPVLAPRGREVRDPSDVPPLASDLPALPAVDTQTSIIAHTTAWSGNLESSGSLHVHGHVEGSITARDDVFVAEEADVDAAISAANVTIAGNVRGSIDCTERFEVLPRGRVSGDVHAPVIVVHEGATIAGEIAMAPSAAAKPTLSPAVPARVARGGD